jgi:hypothetical protein
LIRRPSFLKRQKEQKRVERAAEKRARRQGRRDEREAANRSETDAPETEPIESADADSEISDER